MNIRELIAAVASGLMVMTLVAPAAAKDNLPQIDDDGLHLLKNTNVRAAYAKPGATFDAYSKVLILDCFVQFKEDWQKDYNLQRIGLSGRVS